MTNITKLTIKRSSGYCGIDDAFNEKLVLTPASISYTYLPLYESDIHLPKKWLYQTNSSLFHATFELVAKRIQKLKTEPARERTDVETIDITITYIDKSRKHIRHLCTSDQLAECIIIIKKLIPNSEMMPEILGINTENDS